MRFVQTWDGFINPCMVSQITLSSRSHTAYLRYESGECSEPTSHTIHEFKAIMSNGHSSTLEVAKESADSGPVDVQGILGHWFQVITEAME
jgi:hypothetical protein